MTINRSTLVFFDASCLIAGAGSPSGGSGFLLSLCARGFLRAAVSQPVLLEAQRNIQNKLGEDALSRFYNFLAVVPFILVPVTEKEELRDYYKDINQKDIHVLAAANAVHSPFLITLDKGLLLEVARADLNITALTPSDFIKKILPTHVDYPTDQD